MALAGWWRRLWARSGCGGSGRSPGWCGWAESSLLRRCCGGAVCWRPATYEVKKRGEKITLSFTSPEKDFFFMFMKSLHGMFFKNGPLFTTHRATHYFDGNPHNHLSTTGTHCHPNFCRDHNSQSNNWDPQMTNWVMIMSFICSCRNNNQ